MNQLRLLGILCVCVALPGCSGCRPTPSFTADPLSGDAPVEVTFTDTSFVRGPLGISWDLYFPVTSWNWSFGDGGASTTQNPIHNYETPGAYTVSLTVTNSMGSATTTQTNLVTVNASAPTASFTASETSGDAEFEVTFTDTSEAPGAAITAWLWDFGDGGGSTEQNPTYTYVAPGTYSVTLTVTNSVGSDTVTETDLITVDVGRPRAIFTADPVSGAAPLTVEFTDISLDGSATINAWAWDFGNGASSTVENPIHTYATPGTYDVRLRVTSPLGTNSRTETGFITVLALPSFNFTAEADADNPLTIIFTDTSDPGSSAIDEWIWDFGDGSSSTEQNPTHTYAAPGDYSVRLTVRSEVGGDNGVIIVSVSDSARR